MLATEPDDCIVPNERLVDVRLPLGSEIYDNPRELEARLVAYNNQLIAQGYVSIHPDYLRAVGHKPTDDLAKRSVEYIYDQVGHEEAHNLGAIMAGFSEGEYAFTRKRNGSTDTGWQVAQLPRRPVRAITKLAIGSLTAALQRLSSGDQKTLEALGYRDHVDLAGRITDHNRNNPACKLALPLSILHIPRPSTA